MFASELQKDLWRWVVQQSGLGVEPNYTASRIEILKVIDSTDYTTTINGTPFVYNSGVGATAASIALGLVTAINLGAEPVTAVNGGSGVYTITADDAAFTLNVDANQFINTDKVIWEYSNAPRSKRTYLSLNIANIMIIGQPETIQQDNGIVLIKNGLEFTLNVGAYSNEQPENIDAMILLSELSLATSKIASLDYFRDKKLGFLGVLSLTNLNDLRGSQYEQRASMDLLFQTSMGIYDDVGWIEKVAGTGTFNNTIINDYEINI